MSKNPQLGPSESSAYNYDNCIVLNHDDSNDSVESLFDWHEPVKQAESSSFTNTSEEEGEIEEGHNKQTLLVKIIEESFVLMVGFLNKLGSYMKENPQNDTRKEALNEQRELVMLRLIQNYNLLAQDNGAMCSGEKTPQNEEENVEEDENLDVNEKMNIATRKSKKLESFISKLKNKTSLEKVANKPRNNNKRKAHSLNQEQSKKRRYSDGNEKFTSSRRTSVRKHCNIHADDTGDVYSDRLNKISARIHLALSGEQNSKSNPGIRSSSRTLKKTTKDKGKASNGNKNKEDKNNEVVNQKNNQVVSEGSSSSRKRTLYWAQTWLDNLSKSLP